MRLTGLTLHVVELPLVAPFTTSFGTQTVRRALLLEAEFDIDGELVTGWGESWPARTRCTRRSTSKGRSTFIHRWLVPTLVSAGPFVAESVAEILRPIVGHNMAKAALEMAALEAQLRHREISFADYLGATRRTVPSGCLGRHPADHSGSGRHGRRLPRPGVRPDQAQDQTRLRPRPGPRRPRHLRP